MKHFLLILILAVSAASQWTMGPSSAAPPPPPPPGQEAWRGILDYSRGIDWSHPGVVGGIPTYTFDCGTVQPTGIHAWQPNHNYAVNDVISDSRGNKETVQVAGTSGASEPPNTGAIPPAWPTTAPATTQDGTVTWQMTPGGTDTANVNNAIIACDGKHGVVHLVAGHYYFTFGIMFNGGAAYPQPVVPSRQFNIPISYVLLKGAGPMQTFLHFPRQGMNGDIAIQATAGGFLFYASPPNLYPGGAAAWLGSGSTLDSYTKGDTTLIVGPWDGLEPQINDYIFLDQNNDAKSICPATVPAVPYDCTIPGATQVGTIATIVTSTEHGYHVGQCVGIGDIPTSSAANNTNVGYNIGANPDRTISCNGPPYLPTWWTITAVGCIISGSFVDQSACGSNHIVAFQFDAGRSGLGPNGGGQATTDTLGVWLTSLGGATMTAGSNPQQSSRICQNPQPVATPNRSCLPGEFSIRAQFEAKKITGITLGGQGSCPATAYKCYTIDPGIYMNNWRSSQRPGIWWTGPKDVYDGVEGFTYLPEHDLDNPGSQMGIRFVNAWNGWVRNVRGVEINRNLVVVGLSGNITMEDNYIAGGRGGNSTAYAFEDNGAADTLIMNNICQHVVTCLMTSTVMGRVAAYNYAIDSGYYSANVFNQLMPMLTMNHLAAHFGLFEGNNSVGIQTDNQHGTGGVSTAFRSRSRGQDRPEKNSNRNGLSSSSNNRGLNYIGMVMGTTGIQTRLIDARPTDAIGTTDGYIWAMGRWRPGTGVFGLDGLSLSTAMLWGNYDSATQNTRWCGTGNEPDCSCSAIVADQWCPLRPEVPTSSFTFLPASAIPATHTLPASFFLTGPPYFWTTTWGTPGWPAIGPDVDASQNPALDTTCPITAVTGTGPGSFSQCDGIGHHAYQIPAQICFNNLPVDMQWPEQRSFPITYGSATGSGNGRRVTLTVNNNIQAVSPWTYTIEVTGVNPSTYNGTFQVDSASTSTTIVYWQSIDPGTYQSGGTVSVPNYKVYDAHMCYPNLPY